MSSQDIKLIFTRDFDQWINEMTRNVLVDDFSKVWGVGLQDQIVYFDGETFGWYRYQTDMEAMAAHMSTQPLNNPIFSEERQQNFLREVEKIRHLIMIAPSLLTNPLEHIVELRRSFRRMYILYPLGIFLPGVWRELFLAHHGKEVGEPVLERLYKSRLRSEGLLKLVGNYLRSWLENICKESGYPPEVARLLSVKETEDAIGKRILPNRRILTGRLHGYIYFHNQIIEQNNFDIFCQTHNLHLIDENNSIESKIIVAGMLSSGHGKVKGKVRKIMNSYQVAKFKEGEILITPMTSPEYLPVIKKASAIITDEGGITCHASIVARELNKPCIIGTKIATKVFKDGDEVEVDVDSGIIKKI